MVLINSNQGLKRPCKINYSQKPRRPRKKLEQQSCLSTSPNLKQNKMKPPNHLPLGRGLLLLISLSLAMVAALAVGASLLLCSSIQMGSLVHRCGAECLYRYQTISYMFLVTGLNLNSFNVHREPLTIVFLTFLTGLTS